MTKLKIINEAFWDDFLTAETCPICTSTLEDTGRNFKPGHSPFVCVSRFLRHDIITRKGKITDEEITEYIATNIAKINQDRIKNGKEIL